MWLIILYEWLSWGSSVRQSSTCSDDYNQKPQITERKIIKHWLEYLKLHKYSQMHKFATDEQTFLAEFTKKSHSTDSHHTSDKITRQHPVRPQGYIYIIIWNWRRRKSQWYKHEYGTDKHRLRNTTITQCHVGSVRRRSAHYEDVVFCDDRSMGRPILLF